MGIAEGMGKRNPHQEPDHGECKSQKICFCITGWILLLKNQTLSLITNKCLDNTSSCEKVFSVLWGEE